MKTFFQNLNFSINVKELKPRGYIFQKLYAADYKSYRKEIEGYTLWLWVKSKTIEINDWYSYTKNIIEFYKENFEQWAIENSKLPKPRFAMVLHANHSTGEIKLKDFNEYYKVLLSKNESDFDLYHEKYDHWREIVLIPKLFDVIIKEIDFLTNSNK